MGRFLRFHTPIRDREICRELGIFAVLNELEREDRLSDEDHERVQEVFGWFNEHLPVPRIAPDHWRARFWFRDSAQRMVRRLWEVVAILRHRDVPVALVTTNDPGTIVYRDAYQVAAIARPLRRSR